MFFPPFSPVLFTQLFISSLLNLICFLLFYPPFVPLFLPHLSSYKISLNTLSEVLKWNNYMAGFTQGGECLLKNGAIFFNGEAYISLNISTECLQPNCMYQLKGQFTIRTCMPQINRFCVVIILH